MYGLSDGNCSIIHTMKLINLAFNVLVLLVRFLLRITEHKYLEVLALIVTVVPAEPSVQRISTVWSPAARAFR